MRVAHRALVCLGVMTLACAIARGQSVSRIATPVMVRTSEREPAAGATVTLLGRVALFPVRSDIVDRVQLSTDDRGRALAELRIGIHYVAWAERTADGGAIVVSPLHAAVVPGVATIFELDPSVPRTPRRLVIAERKGWLGPIAAQLLLDGEASPLAMDLESDEAGGFRLPTLPATALKRVQFFEPDGLGSCGFAEAQREPFVETRSYNLPELVPIRLEVRGGAGDLPVAGSRVGLIESGVWREVGSTDDDGALAVRFSARGSIERVFTVGPGTRGAGPAVRSADGRRLITHTRDAGMFRFRLSRAGRPFPSARLMIRQFGMHVQTATSHSIAHAWREIRPDDGGVVVVEGIHTDKDNPTFLELHEAGLAVLPRSLAQLWPIIPGAPQLGRTSHGPQDPPVDVDLEEMVPVEWRVTHVDGTPAVGARIEVVAFTARRSVTKSRILPVAIAGRDGSLRMLLPPHGDYVVAVIHDFGGAIVGVHTGRGSLDEIHSVPVVLESAVTVTGTVVDRAGQPAPMAMLWFAVPHPRGRDPATEPAAAGPDRALTDITEQLPEFAYLGVQEHFEPRSCRADEKGEFAVRFPLRGRGWVLRAGGEDVAIEGAALGRERVTLMYGR